MPKSKQTLFISFFLYFSPYFSCLTQNMAHEITTHAYVCTSFLSHDNDELTHYCTQQTLEIGFIYSTVVSWQNKIKINYVVNSGRRDYGDHLTFLASLFSLWCIESSAHYFRKYVRWFFTISRFVLFVTKNKVKINIDILCVHTKIESSDRSNRTQVKLKQESKKK